MNRRHDKLGWPEVMLIVCCCGILAVSLWWAKIQFDECRSMDFSVMYCIKHAM